MVSCLLHLLAAALHRLVGVYAGGDGGQLLLVLTLAHLEVHAVDEVLHCDHLQEEQHESQFCCGTLTRFIQHHFLSAAALASTFYCWF